MLLPFKREFFFIVRSFFRPGESAYRHLHFNGIFKVKVDDAHSFKIMHYGYQVENEIFWAGLEGGWEKVSVSLWVKLCKKAKVIVDVGANTGVYCLIAKALNNNAQVFAFEPVKRVYDKLQYNTGINRFDIKCFPVALSNYTGKAIVFDTDTEHVYSVTVNKNLYSKNTRTIETQIDTITLAQVIEQNSLTRLDLIKIDVETHEAEVLEGFGVYLRTFRPAMLIEILNDEVGARVEKLVAGLGYLFFNIDEKKGARRVEKIGKSDYFNYLLCDENEAREIGLI